MKSLASTCLIAAMAAISLAACNRQSPDGNASAAASAAATAAKPSTPIIPAPSPTNAATAGLPGDHAITRQYRIDITLPKLAGDEQPLANALRTTADNAKRQFLQALPEPSAEPANRRFDLIVRFDIAANTPTFTSARETGMQDTGGAHPNPLDAAFVYDRKAGKLVALDDLFARPDDARKALANFAHDTLLRRFTSSAPRPGQGSPDAILEWKANMVQMLDNGTRPTTVNYSMFVVRAGATASSPSPGITLIFPPYQVAPYVFGTQTVNVPASVFAQYLKAQYRAAFAADGSPAS